MASRNSMERRTGDKGFFAENSLCGLWRYRKKRGPSTPFGFRLTSLRMTASEVSRFRVSGFGFRVSGFGFQVSGFQVSGVMFDFSQIPVLTKNAGNEASGTR